MKESGNLNGTYKMTEGVTKDGGADGNGNT